MKSMLGVVFEENPLSWTLLQFIELVLVQKALDTVHKSTKEHCNLNTFAHIDDKLRKKRIHKKNWRAVKKTVQL